MQSAETPRAAGTVFPRCRNIPELGGAFQDLRISGFTAGLNVDRYNDKNSINNHNYDEPENWTRVKNQH